MYNGCIGSGLDLELSSWHKLCTYFSVWTVGVVEGGDNLVLQGSVNHPTLVLLPSLLLVLS